MAFCSNCDKKIIDSSKFCPDCGNKLNLTEMTVDSTPVETSINSEQVQLENKESNGKQSKIDILFIIVSIVLATFGCIFIAFIPVIGLLLFIAAAALLAMPVIFQVRMDKSQPPKKREIVLKKTPKPISCTILAVILCTFAFPFIKDNIGSSKNSIKDITKAPYVSSWLSLESHSVEVGRYGTKIIGVVSTNDIGNVTINSGAIIRVKFYDKDGNILEEKYDISSGLKDGDRWKFEVIVPVNTAEYEITSVDIRN